MYTFHTIYRHLRHQYNIYSIFIFNVKMKTTYFKKHSENSSIKYHTIKIKLTQRLFVKFNHLKKKKNMLQNNTNKTAGVQLWKPSLMLCVCFN